LRDDLDVGLESEQRRERASDERLILREDDPDQAAVRRLTCAPAS
jgi:hypothetical protein